MENGTVKTVFKNNRYKIVHSDLGYYLMDSDQSIIGYLCFVLNWIVPQKIYIIDEHIADDLLVHSINNEIRSKNKLFVVIIVLSIVFFQILSSEILHYGSNSSTNYSQIYKFGDAALLMPSVGKVLLLLITVSIPAIIIRVYLSVLSKKKLYKKIEYTTLTMKKIRVVPSSFTTILKSLGVYLLFAFVLAIAFFLVIVSDNYWIISMCFTMILTLFLLTNRLAVTPTNYKIRYIKEK